MHVPPDGVLNVHSVAEAFLYVSLTYCPRCQRRPVRAAGDLTRSTDGAGWTLEIECTRCAKRSSLRFRVEPPPTSANAARINSTHERSAVIDVAGWLALFRVIADGAANEPNRLDARGMTLEAAQCLDEALRFYAPGQELPDDSACYDDSSRERLRSHPEQFQHSRLRAMRDKLPAVPVGDMPESKPRKRWWRIW